MKTGPLAIFIFLSGFGAYSTCGQAAMLEAPGPVVSTNTIPSLIQSAADDRSPVVRENAQKALLDLGPDAIPGLEKALIEGSDPVRATAVQLLGDLSDPKTIPALSQAALKDPYRLVRSRALKALDHIPHAQVTPVFISALSTDRDPNVRATAADALGRSTEPTAVTALIGALGDLEDEVSNAAIEALASMRPPPTEALLKAAKDKRPLIRLHAAQALGSTEDPDVVPPLVKLLKDNDPLVRRAAIESLTELNATQTLPQIQDLLKSEKDPGVQQAAQEAQAAMAH